MKPTAKVSTYALLAGLGLLASVAFQRPAFAALATPFALALALGLVLPRGTVSRVTATPRDRRVLEGDELVVDVRIETDRPVERVELLLVSHPHLVAEPGEDACALNLSSRSRSVAFTRRPTRWGAYPVLDLAVRTRDLLGFFVHETRFGGGEQVRVYPMPEALRRFALPRDTQVLAGNQTARRTGEGIEFADLRAFVPGDRLRDVNWRVTARRGEMWVNQRHPDRNADVVVFLDVFADESLDDAVRAASVIVAQYLAQRDRVGLVSFGGTVGWVPPGSGTRQQYRIIDALIQSQVFANEADKDIDVLPGRVLPPQALVIALTPLEDPRVQAALMTLRRRGRDVAVVEIAPSARHLDEGEVGLLGWRLWQLERKAVRRRLEHLGAVVVPWSEQPGSDPNGRPFPRQPLEVVGEELRAHRRRSLRAG